MGSLVNKKRANVFAGLIKYSFKELAKNDPLRMAGATAFFTTFALPPICIILIQVLGLIFDPAKMSQQLFAHLNKIVGRAGTRQVMETFFAFRELAQNWWIIIFGFLFLCFVATTLFANIKNSLNQIWKIRVVEKENVWRKFKKRLASVFVIIITGLLFVVGLLAEGMQAFLGQYVEGLIPELSNYFNSVFDYLISLFIVTVWFAILFGFLPDGRTETSVILTGAFVTSILFNVGKYLLRWLLTYSNIKNLYGASGSIVLLLLFVFYSSLILYFGAAFTKAWALHRNKPIKALPHAMHYQLVLAKDDS